jgi:hypothetical protein
MNLIWLIAVFLFPVFGSLLYLLLKKKFTTKEKRVFNPEFLNRARLN